MLKIIELFAGIGSQTQALKNLGIPHEVVAISDIDKFADKSYRALHGEVNNMGDITKIEELPKADLWTISAPCVDISLAGLGKGLDKEAGTRSGLLWEVERLLIKAKENGILPKYLLLENVKNLLGRKHKANYDKWVAFLSELGYTTYTKVLNAKNYGVPQNRERVFGVSILGDHTPYIFPEPQPLTKRLKDILEDEVDEKFYLAEKTIKSILSSTYNSRRKDTIHKQTDICKSLRARDSNEPKCVVVGTIDEGKWAKVTEMHQRVYSPDGLSPTITAQGGGNQEKKIIIDEQRDTALNIVDDFYPNRIRAYSTVCPTIRAGREGLKVVALRGRNYSYPTKWEQQLEPRADNCTNTLTSVAKDNLVLENCTIRKLTPKECWRLMGWADAEIDKARAVSSNAQAYRQAGNGIVVPVLEAIFKNLFQIDFPIAGSQKGEQE